jgi:hypothetical protein
MTQCTKCLRLLPLSEFHKHTTGLRRQCKACRRLYSHDYYLAHKEACLSYTKAWALANQDKRQEIERRAKIKKAQENPFKTCTKCKQLKALSHFTRKRTRKSSCCRECQHETYVKTREQAAIRAKAYYVSNRSKLLIQQRHKRHDNPECSLWLGARRRARKYGLEFTISPSDIVIPMVCPILLIPLSIGDGKAHYGSPTLDRKNPKIGYTSENIHVISFRANTIKSDASVEELKAVAEFCEKNPFLMTYDRLKNDP